MLVLYVISGSLAYYHYADLLDDDKLRWAAEHKVCELMRSSSYVSGTSRQSMSKSRKVSYSEPNPVSASQRGSTMSGSRRMSQAPANAWVDENMVADRSVVSPSKMSGRRSFSDASASRGNRMANDNVVSPRSGRNSVESSAVLPFNQSTSSRRKSESSPSMSQRSGRASYGSQNPLQTSQRMENNYVGTPRSGRDSRSPRSVSPHSRRPSYGSKNAYPSPKSMKDDNRWSPRSGENVVVESSEVLPFNPSDLSTENSMSHHPLSSPFRRPSYGSHNPLQPSQLMENNYAENRPSGGNSMSNHSIHSPSYRGNNGSQNPLQPPMGVENDFAPKDSTLSESGNSNPYDQFTRTNEYSPKKYSVQAKNYDEDQPPTQDNYSPPERTMSQNPDLSSGTPYFNTSSSQGLVQFPPVEDGLGNSYGSV